MRVEPAGQAGTRKGREGMRDEWSSPRIRLSRQQVYRVLYSTYCNNGRYGIAPRPKSTKPVSAALPQRRRLALAPSLFGRARLAPPWSLACVCAHAAPCERIHVHVHVHTQRARRLHMRRLFPRRHWRAQRIVRGEHVVGAPFALVTMFCSFACRQPAKHFGRFDRPCAG